MKMIFLKQITKTILTILNLRDGIFFISFSKDRNDLFENLYLITGRNFCFSFPNI